MAIMNLMILTIKFFHILTKAPVLPPRLPYNGFAEASIQSMKKLVSLIDCALANSLCIGGKTPLSALLKIPLKIFKNRDETNTKKRFWTMYINQQSIVVLQNHYNINLGGIVKGGSSLFMFIPPFDKKNFIMANNYPVGTYKWLNAKRTEFDSSQFDSQFKDTPYWDTYQGILNQYDVGPEAQWFGFLGADSKNAYNHNQARMNAINALLEQKRADEYNSPEQQAARERSAGMNPDLLGLSDVGETDTASVPNEKEMHYENPIPHIVSFLTMLGGAASGVQAMKGQQIVQQGMQLENYAKMKGIVLDTLGSFSPYSDTDISPSIKIDYGINRRQQKKLDRLTSDFFGSVEHEISWRKRHGDKAAERQRLFNITSSPGYSDDDITMRKTAKFIADELLNIQKLDLQAGKHSSSANVTRKRIWKDTINSERGFVKWLRDRADKGDVVATRLLLSLIGSDNMQESKGIVSPALGALTKLL